MWRVNGTFPRRYLRNAFHSTEANCCVVLHRPCLGQNLNTQLTANQHACPVVGERKSLSYQQGAVVCIRLSKETLEILGLRYIQTTQNKAEFAYPFTPLSLRRHHGIAMSGREDVKITNDQVRWREMGGKTEKTSIRVISLTAGLRPWFNMRNRPNTANKGRHTAETKAPDNHPGPRVSEGPGCVGALKCSVGYPLRETWLLKVHSEWNLQLEWERWAVIRRAWCSVILWGDWTPSMSVLFNGFLPLAGSHYSQTLWTGSEKWSLFLHFCLITFVIVSE